MLKIAINIPVRDLDSSTTFFSALGFDVSAQFAADTNMNRIDVSDDISIMLLTEPRFKAVSGKNLIDATKNAEAIVQLRVESRQRVDELVDRAFAAGGTPHHDTNDQGYFYGRSFQDLDGHLWDVFFLQATPADSE